MNSKAKTNSEIEADSEVLRLTLLQKIFDCERRINRVKLPLIEVDFNNHTKKTNKDLKTVPLIIGRGPNQEKLELNLSQNIDLSGVDEIIIEQLKIKELTEIKLVKDKNYTNSQNAQALESSSKSQKQQVESKPKETFALPMPKQEERNRPDVSTKNTPTQNDPENNNTIFNINDNYFREESRVDSIGVEYEKESFRPRSVSEKSEYFYKVKNHQDLVKIGNSYMADFKNGLKNFAFSAGDSERSQPETILGLTNFFNYYQDVKILVIAANLLHGPLKKFAKEAQMKNILIDGSNSSICIFKHKMFDLIDLQEFYHLKEAQQVEGLVNSLPKILEQYEMVLWSLPPISEMEKHIDTFFPLSMEIDSLTLLVSVGSSTVKKLTEIKTFFDKYGIPIKGCLLDKNAQGKKKFNIF
jgi:hypothetical protein